MIYLTDNKRHLVCYPYSIPNLHLMAQELGIKRCWFHKHHYDVPIKRMAEIAAKCHIVTDRNIVSIKNGEDMPELNDILNKKESETPDS